MMPPQEGQNRTRLGKLARGYGGLGNMEMAHATAAYGFAAGSASAVTAGSCSRIVQSRDVIAW